MPGAANVQFIAPLIRQNPWFPGQLGGVPGVSNDTGLRTDSNARVVYVDPNKTGVSDGRDGTDPDEPMATVEAALTKCRAYCNDTIIVAPSSYWTHADVSVGRATPVQEEITVDVPGVRIVGLMPPGSLGVPWIPETDNGVCITVHAMDVLIEGFCFWDAEALTAPVAIQAVWDGATMYGDNLTVRNCYFGYMSYGILLDFSYYTNIYNNYFDGLAVAAIQSMDVEGDPDYCTIHHNWFVDNVLAIDLEDVSYCMIHHNLIYGDGTGTNNFIDLTGGGDNLVAHNALACTLAQYPTTCSDSTSGAWIDNNCINGPTTANPT